MCFAMQGGIQHAGRDERAADFGGPGLPKGSKILEEAAMLAANCRTAGLGNKGTVTSNLGVLLTL